MIICKRPAHPDDRGNRVTGQEGEKKEEKEEKKEEKKGGGGEKGDKCCGLGSIRGTRGRKKKRPPCSRPL